MKFNDFKYQRPDMERVAESFKHHTKVIQEAKRR